MIERLERASLNCHIVLIAQREGGELDAARRASGVSAGTADVQCIAEPGISES